MQTSDFSLTPPEPKDIRFTLFRDVVASFYRWKWGMDCPWDGSEARQLKTLLGSSPTLDIQTFRMWLYNYGCSDDITPGERPRSFLPRMHDYSITPLDRFRRDPNAAIQTAKTQGARRSRAAFERVRSRGLAAAGATGNLSLEGRVERSGNRELAQGFRPIQDTGD